MSIQPSVPAPESLEAKALAELENEGHVISTGKPDTNDGEIKDTPIPSKEENKVESPKEEPKAIPEEKKPERSPTMVEAWKLKVAEDQKQAIADKVADLEEQIKKLSKQDAPVSQSQYNTIADEIKDLAKDKDVDVEFLTKFADSIISRTESKYKPANETLKKLQEERELEKQLNEYSMEFEKDVLPLVANSQLTGDALSQLKSTLRDYAFSETYAKVPLKEIFSIKQSELNLPTIKKSSEGKSMKSRANDVIDIDNISEDDFSKLPTDKIEEFVKKKSESAWKR